MDKPKLISSRSIHEGRVVRLHIDTLDLGDGSTTDLEVMYHGGAAAILPFETDDSVILVEQYRRGSDQVMLELPAGGLDEGESPDDAARRELQEEIGFYPEQLEFLGHFWVAASYTTEKISIYIARDLRPSTLPADLDERIKIVRMPFDEALEMALDNRITDAKTVMGLIWAGHKLGRIGEKE
jgi:ADP-ribose pyrophosphatase